MKAGTQDVTPLTPEERRKLVEAPLPVVRTIGSTRSWGGTSVADWCDGGKSRAYTQNLTGRQGWLKILNGNDN